MRGTLREIKDELRRRMHQPIPEQGAWIEQVVRGYFARSRALSPRPLHLAPTLSALSVSSFADFVDHIGQLGERTGACFFWRPSLIDEPASLSPFVTGLPGARWLDEAAEVARRWGWTELQRWIEAVAGSLRAGGNDISPTEAGTSRFLRAIDERRGTAAGEVFPELSAFL